MRKTAGVYTNDKTFPRQDLAIKGPVERFVTIRPQHANMRGYVGEPVKNTVTIIPEKKYPFKILKVHAKNGKYIKYQLEEIHESGNPVYELKIENMKQEAGRYYDSIILETDSKIKPKIDVRIYGHLRPRKTE